MESQSSPAEELPALYRAILDGVAHLESIGQRREAALVRAQATTIYSTSWDESGRRRLQQLERRIERVVTGRERARNDQPGPWRILVRSATSR
jgi:hypothetical protein